MAVGVRQQDHPTRLPAGPAVSLAEDPAYLHIRDFDALPEVLRGLPAALRGGAVVIYWPRSVESEARPLGAEDQPPKWMPRSPAGDQRTLDPCLFRALQFIHGHFQGRLRLGQVSAVARLSPSHFSRVFKRQVGMPYTRYLASLRVDQAQILLTTTVRSVTEICYEVGFNDLSHFERVFQRLIGISPSRYRRNVVLQQVQDVPDSARKP